MLGVSAAGFALKLLFILPPMAILSSFSDEINNFYDFSSSGNGWITGDIFKNWLENQFMSHKS